MTWDDFYDRYCDWSESTVRSRISSLEDIGNGEDVVDVVLNLSDEKIKAQLVRKAMRLGVKFTQDDFMHLDGELPDEVFEEVAKFGGFYLDNPYFDENDFDWDDFYAECGNLPEDMLLRCISRIKKFGDADEVVDAILTVSDPADDALYDRAISCGVRFTDEQKELMGRGDFGFVKELKAFNSLSDQESREFANRVKTAEKQVDADMWRMKNTKKKKSSVGKAIGLGAVIGLLKGLFGSSKRHGGRCNGDCKNCPAHYGYRYGRWYYGHGHTRGCEFGGNKGGGGKQ